MKRSLILSLLFGVAVTISFCLAIWIRNLVYQPHPRRMGNPTERVFVPRLVGVGAGVSLQGSGCSDRV